MTRSGLIYWKTNNDFVYWSCLVNTELSEINERVPKGYFWHGQTQHLLFLMVLVPGALYLVSPHLDGGSFIGVTDRTWVVLLIATVVIQQVLGWLVFRLQICYSALSRWFGRADIIVWGVLFFPLLIGRVFFHIAVGMSDFGSLTAFRPLQIILGLALLAPVFYTLWSIKHYFGIERALGGDHFRANYREMPLVREGAFRFSSNAMYSFAFLLFWAIALLTGSWAALGLALFQHAYIWVHVYCTEDPDVHILFGQQG
jgi:hypothetical protein